MVVINEPHRLRPRGNVSRRFQKLCAPDSVTRISGSTSEPKPRFEGREQTPSPGMFMCRGCYFIYEEGTGFEVQGVLPRAEFVTINEDCFFPDSDSNKATFRPVFI